MEIGELGKSSNKTCRPEGQNFPESVYRCGLAKMYKVVPRGVSWEEIPKKFAFSTLIFALSTSQRGGLAFSTVRFHILGLEIGAKAQNRKAEKSKSRKVKNFLTMLERVYLEVAELGRAFRRNIMTMADFLT